VPDVPVTTPQDESVWRPPFRAYEHPPSAPLRINRAERREAIRHWQRAGVIDERGAIAHDWKTVVGAIFG
jgi:hypothetical protein